MGLNKYFKRNNICFSGGLFSAALLSSCGLSSEEAESSSAREYDSILTVGIVVPDTGDYSCYSIGTELIMEKIAENFHEETGTYLQYYIAEDYDSCTFTVLEDESEDTEDE